jgi:polar amino acid transport system substrate-binding protein
MKARSLVAAALATSLLLVACGSDDGDEATTAAGPDTASCDAANLPLKSDGTLTVATGEPAFLPWVADDKPESGEGFESALVYAVADELGLAKDDVSWVRTGFDEAIGPGKKSFDLNVQQFSITPDRAKVVDFSDGYYEVQQAIVAAKDSPVAGAKSLADLKSAKLGAAIGTTSLTYIEDVIKPSSQPSVFDDNAAAKAAFDAGQVDGIVFDLPTAYYITAVEITNASIVGVLPIADAPEELGFLFEKGSPLVGCVNDALAALKDDGTLADLQQEWLTQGGDIPTLAE